jgi:electron transfer flavoprotein alpha/beta subunit
VTGGLLAGLRGLPYLPKVFDAAGRDGGLWISQEVAGGIRTGILRTVAVLSATNAPTTILRMPNVRAVLLAARTPVDVVDAGSLLEDAARRERLADERVSPRRLGRAGRRVEGEPSEVAKALLAELEEQGVLGEARP